MKKFLTVLLVIAVMFTFSFSSAFAAAPEYSYEQAQAKIEKSAQDLKDDALASLNAKKVNATDVAVTTVGGESISITISAEAICKVYDEAYKEYVKNVNKGLSAQLVAFDAAVSDKANYKAAESAFNSYYVTSSTPIPGGTVGSKPSYTAPTGTAPDRDFLEAEFDLVKDATVKGLQAIDLSVYSTKKVNAVTPSNYENAKSVVDDAVDSLLTKYTYTALTADLDIAKMIYNMDLIYVAPEGVTPFDGLIKTVAYNANALMPYAVNGWTHFNGLAGLPKLDAPETAEAKLSYAKSTTLSGVIAELSVNKNDALAALQAAIMVESDKTAPNAKTIAGYKDQQASIEAAYKDAVEVITYLIENAEEVKELGSYNPATFVYTYGWKSPDVNATNYATFAAATVSFPAGADVYNTTGKYDTTSTPHTVTVANLSSIVDLVNAAKDKAEYLKAQVLIDGAQYANIDKALEDSVDDIYRGKGTELTGVSTTRAEDALYHYVNKELIGTVGDYVTVNGKKYETTANWDANAGLYDTVKYKEVVKITDETEKALKSATTKDEADAAFVAGYEKFDAVITAAEHRADFIYATGANHAKYEQVQAELTAYVTAKRTLLANLDKIDDYPTLNGVTTYYNGTTGKFYTKCFTAEELDAKLAEAKAVVDGLKTEKVLEEEANAIVKSIPALTTAKLTDKEAVMAVYDQYAAHNDYCDLVGSNEKIVNYKIVRLAKDIEEAEATALEDAAAAIAKDGKVTLDEKAAVEALRKAYDAYYEYWIKSGDYAAIGSTLNLDNYGANYNLAGFATNGILTATAGVLDVEDFEAIIDRLEADAVIETIGKLPAVGATTEQVKAAKAAFEALSRDAKEMVYHTAQYDKLVDAEKLLVGDVETLKITASSKATKGAITVKWTVKGDAEAADGFQVWKSTKMNKGYKKAFTTTKTSYKNTKGLKKGTKYYYKVRAYKVVDGKMVYSDWSNKAYRTAK